MKIRVPTNRHMTAVEIKLAHAILAHSTEIGAMAKSPRKAIELVAIDKTSDTWTAEFRIEETAGEKGRYLNANGEVELKNKARTVKVEIYGEGVVAMPSQETAATETKASHAVEIVTDKVEMATTEAAITKERLDSGITKWIDYWLNQPKPQPLTLSTPDSMATEDLEYAKAHMEYNFCLNQIATEYADPKRGTVQCLFPPTSVEEDRQAVIMMLQNGFVDGWDTLHYRLNKYKMIANPYELNGLGAALITDATGTCHRVPFIITYGGLPFNQQAFEEYHGYLSRNW